MFFSASGVALPYYSIAYSPTTAGTYSLVIAVNGVIVSFLPRTMVITPGPISNFVVNTNTSSYYLAAQPFTWVLMAPLRCLTTLVCR